MTFKNLLEKYNTPKNIIISIVVISVLFISYGVWVETRSSNIDIYVPKQGATIFLDEKMIEISNKDNQIIKLKRILPGEHSLLVSLQGYYPWGKTIMVKSGKATTLRPFFIKKDITPSYIKTQFTDKERADIEKNITDAHVNKKVSFFGEGNIEIRKDKNKIFATWLGETSSMPDFFCDYSKCEKDILVFRSNVGNIGDINFYPGRDDVVLFSLNKNIYAIEIDKNGAQNFQPVYFGESPLFTTRKQSSILFVKDGKTLFGVML